jgi:hypothetical protein
MNRGAKIRSAIHQAAKRSIVVATVHIADSQM